MELKYSEVGKYGYKRLRKEKIKRIKNTVIGTLVYLGILVVIGYTTSSMLIK